MVSKDVGDLVDAGRAMRRFVHLSPCRCTYLGDGDSITCTRCVVISQWDRAVADTADQGANALPESDRLRAKESPA